MYAFYFEAADMQHGMACNRLGERVQESSQGRAQIHQFETWREVVDLESVGPWSELNTYDRCPLYENAYSPESMHNRVSRYPFPDHHPPPLPLLPLAVREITAWLEGDPERVAIIHCKAGKVSANEAIADP
jgi:protein-tyrosine phosphatase